MNNNEMIPLSCKGVKCMVEGCGNLSAHKVNEENVWCNFGSGFNDEKDMYDTFKTVSTFLCNDHFNMITEKEVVCGLEDDRFNNRFK
jgi:hypothetical protein